MSERTEEQFAAADTAGGQAADPFLLVPVTLEALVVGERDLLGNWSLGEMDFNKVSSLNQAPSDPDPGPNTTDALPEGSAGVHLHWALPDALAHGVGDDEGAITYPFIPNRWLVVRLYPDGGERPSLRAARGWVLESDFVDPRAGTSSYPAPFADEDDPARPPAPTKIGRATPADRWSEPGGARFFLRAPGPSNPAFAAFYPNVHNVLGFHDDLSDLGGAGPSDPIALTYAVFGWYSDPQGDPLSRQTAEAHGDFWRSFVENCRWSVGGEQLAQSPARTLCHGMLVFPTEPEAGGLNAPWSGAADTSYIPATNPQMLVAVGNSAAEALSALVDSQHQAGEPDPSRQVERLLEAFQYNLLVKLDEAGGDVELTRKIHQMGFESRPGGSRWKVTMWSGQADVAETSGLQTPPLDDAQRQQLGALNVAQQQFDALGRQLEGLRRKLFALWWKKIFVANYLNPRKPKGSQADYPTLIAGLEAQIAGLRSRLDELGPGLDAARAALASALDETMQLVEETAPRFWRAADPVVLVSGAGRNYKHGEDGRFTGDGTLACRWAGEVVGAIRLPADYPPGNAKGQVEIGAADLNLRAPAVGPAASEIAALVAEAYFLDWRNAPALAALPAVSRLGVSPEAVAAQQAAPWNAVADGGFDPRTLQEQSGLRGTVPSKVGFTLWSSPWSPLFLDWEVSWVPTYSDRTRPLVNWQFGGYDYAYAGGAAADPVSYSGRTLLTPHVTEGMRTCLEQFAQGDLLKEVEADLEGYFGQSGQEVNTYQDLVEAVRNWDVLSQSLGGLTELLTQRQPAYLAEPYDPSDPGVAAAVGDANDHLPLVGTSPEGHFFPVRAGFFRLTSLRVVDCFGHAIDVLEHAPPYPVRSGPLVPTAPGADDPRYVFAPPRLAQPSRLSLRLLSSEDDAQDADSYHDVNPVCGWVLPDRLTGELAVYDAGGKALGQLLTVRDETPRVRWDAPPGVDGGGGPEGIANPHLRRFVVSLLRPNLDGGEALARLMQVIDSTLWTVDPLGERSNEHLSVLVGRPLAVIRAELQLELDADPLEDLSWGNTGSTAEPDWAGASFPVWLGDLASRDDGLVGFCLDDESDGDLFRTFHGVYRLGGPPDSFISPDNTVGVTPQWPGGGGARPRGRLLVMLVDPRGGVYARTGLLPAAFTRLPQTHVTNALAAMSVTFRTGPLLCDPAGARIPLPAGISGTWSWLYRTSPDSWQTDAGITQSDDRARLPDRPPRAVEGWLKLGGAVGKGQ